MIAYIDSSVLLRVALNQKGKLKEFKDIQKPISSKLLKTESLRTIDRLKVMGRLTESEFISTLEQLYECFDSVELIDISDIILDRAGGSSSVSLGTLDAIHLHSAIAWREITGAQPCFLTHDEILGLAARASGFQVFGC